MFHKDVIFFSTTDSQLLFHGSSCQTCIFLQLVFLIRRAPKFFAQILSVGSSVYIPNWLDKSISSLVIACLNYTLYLDFTVVLVHLKSTYPLVCKRLRNCSQLRTPQYYFSSFTKWKPANWLPLRLKLFILTVEVLRSFSPECRKDPTEHQDMDRWSTLPP